MWVTIGGSHTAARLGPITRRMSMRAVRATLNSAGEFKYQVTRFQSKLLLPF